MHLFGNDFSSYLSKYLISKGKYAGKWYYLFVFYNRIGIIISTKRKIMAKKNQKLFNPFLKQYFLFVFKLSDLIDCCLRSSPSLLSSQNLGFSLLHHNEFKAAYEQFTDIQKKHYFNARNWTNIGSTFLSKVLFRSRSEALDSMSQINSRSIYNSNRSHISKKKENANTDPKPSNLSFLKGEALLTRISKSQEYVDFAIEKDNQDQTKLAISCLKRSSIFQFI